MNSKVFHEVTIYLEEISNSDGVVDYNQISKLALCPAPIFQRIFSFMTDMSISEYVRKRRLTLAAIELRNTDQTVLDIALKYGFQSHSAFSRAFREYHGITPSQVKYSTGSLNNCLPINISNVRLIGGKKIMAEVKKIIYQEVEERIMVGMKRETSTFDCGNLWSEYFKSKEFELVSKLSVNIRQWDDLDDYEGISIAYNYTDETHFTVLIGDFVKVGAEIPEGLFSKTIPGGCIAHIQIEGNNLDDIISSGYFLISEAVEKTGRKFDNNNLYWCEIYTCERYCEPMRKGEKVILDYIVPIEKELGEDRL